MTDVIDNTFSFCPKCGSKKIEYIENKKWACSDCGFKLYSNVAAAVGLIIVDENDNVLFEVRAKDPKKGFLAFPGGFCNPDETAEEAALRECMEELGAEPDALSYLCSFPNTYDYKNIRYKTCDLFFVAKMHTAKSGKLMERFKLQASEVSGLVAKSIRSEKDVDELPLAFGSAVKTLKLWLKNKEEK